jgi:hypothetical protein
MEKTTQQRNKDIVLEAFDTLFNKRDYATARDVLVSEVHSAQRAHRAGSRRTLQSNQEHSRHPEI